MGAACHHGGLGVMWPGGRVIVQPTPSGRLAAVPKPPCSAATPVAAQSSPVLCLQGRNPCSPPLLSPMPQPCAPQGGAALRAGVHTPLGAAGGGHGRRHGAAARGLGVRGLQARGPGLQTTCRAHACSSWSKGGRTPVKGCTQGAWPKASLSALLRCQITAPVVASAHAGCQTCLGCALAGTCSSPPA